MLEKHEEASKQRGGVDAANCPNVCTPVGPKAELRRRRFLYRAKDTRSEVQGTESSCSPGSLPFTINSVGLLGAFLTGQTGNEFEESRRRYFYVNAIMLLLG
ncbi:unnamed protein product [Hapterophycus canaliculatus]